MAAAIINLVERVQMNRCQPLSVEVATPGNDFYLFVAALWLILNLL